MKTQQERNSLRQKVDGLNRQLISAEAGSGLTQKSEQLNVAEEKLADLNSELDIQKSKYEFHIQQLKKKIEMYTTMLEEKGMNSEDIKTRMSSDFGQPDGTIGNAEEQTKLDELKSKYEQEINGLRDEIDILIISRDKEKDMVKQMQEQFELDLEHHRSQFQKDLIEAREEIEIYQKLLAEEKENSGNLHDKGQGDLETCKLRHELDTQKSHYDAEVGKLTQENQRLMKEIETFAEELCKKSLETKVLDQYRQEVDNMKAGYESKMEEMSKILEKENITDSKECQTDLDKRERHVSFNWENELENQKEVIRQLTEERNAYEAALEELQLESEEKMEKLNAELNTFKEVQSLKSMSVDTHQSIMDEIQAAESCKRKFTATDEDEQSFTNDVKKMRKSVEKSISVGQISDYLHEEDMDEIKLRYENEIKDLKSKINELSDFSFRQDREKQESIEKSEQLNLDASETEQKFKEQILELEKKASEYESLWQLEKENKERLLESVDERRVSKDEHETMKRHYQDEISELKDEIKIYTDLLNEEKQKLVSRNTECDDISGRYTKEIERLKEEIQTLEKLYEAEKDKSKEIDNLKECTNDYQTEVDEKVKELENDHLMEIEKMKEEFQKFAETHFENENHIRNQYEDEIESLKERLKNFQGLKQEADLPNGNNSKEEICTVEKLIEKHQSELNGIKQEYGEKVLALQAELEKYMKLNTELDVTAAESLKEKEELIRKLEVKQVNRETGNECQMKDQGQDMVDYLKKRVQELEIELENDKEKTLKSNNLQIEILKAEVEDLKAAHMQEIETLNSKLLEYESVKIDNGRDGENISLKLHEATIQDLKDIHAEELKELTRQLQEFQKSCSSAAEDNDTLFSLQTEMLRAEIDELKVSHAEEIERLKNQLSDSESRVENLGDGSLILKNVEALQQSRNGSSSDQDEEVKGLKAQIEELKATYEAETEELKRRLEIAEGLGSDGHGTCILMILSFFPK